MWLLCNIFVKFVLRRNINIVHISKKGVDTCSLSVYHTHNKEIRKSAMMKRSTSEVLPAVSG